MKNSKEIAKASENQGLPSDQADFLSLHQTIIMCGSMASNALIEMAKNLKEMRDRKLYTAGGFNSFSEYVENFAQNWLNAIVLPKIQIVR